MHDLYAGWTLHGAGAGDWTTRVSRAAPESGAAGAEAADEGMGMDVLTVWLPVAGSCHTPGTVQTILKFWHRSASALPWFGEMS